MKLRFIQKIIENLVLKINTKEREGENERENGNLLEERDVTASLPAFSS